MVQQAFGAGRDTPIMRLPLPLLKVVLTTTCLRPAPTLIRALIPTFFFLDRAIGAQRAFPRRLALDHQHRAFGPPPIAASPLPSGGEEPNQEQEGLFISKEDINKLPIGKYEGVIHWVRSPH